MAIKLFQKGQGYKIEPTAEGLSLPFIDNLFKKDKTKDKVNALKECSYLYWCYHPESNYKQAYRLKADGGDREVRVKNAIFGENSVWFPDETMEAAIKGFHDILYKANPLAKVLASAETAFLKLEDYFDNIDMVATKKNGDLLYSPTALQKTIEGLSKSAQELTKLKKQVLESIGEDTAQLRGDVKKSKYNT